MQLLLSLQNYCGANNFAGNTHLKVVPIEWIQSFPDFSSDGHNLNSGIVLKSGKQWMIMPCVSDTIDFRERERTTKHGPTITPTISAFIANDTPNIAAVMNSMNGYKWIAILQYKTGESKVIGHPEAPARFTSSFNNGSRLTDSKGYEIEFYSTSDEKSFFIESPEIITDTCAAATWRLVDSDNNVLSTGTINSGEEDDIPAPDTTLQINGVNEGSFASGSTIDLQLTDGTNPVVPDSVVVVGDVVTATLPACPPAVSRSTATLIKTGQLTSYRTGDDGDIQAGRVTDFFTLDAAPVHNDGSATLNTTTNRFTDINGLQVYPNNWVLDWSTWNGLVLLGFWKGDFVNTRNWNDSVDFCLNTFDGFASRIPNANEMMILTNYNTLQWLNYAPFNFNINQRFWTGTAINASNFYAYFPNSRQIGQAGATALYFSMPVKTFNLPTTNILS